MKTTDALFQSIYPKDGMLVVGLVAQVGTNLDDLCAAIKTRIDKKKYQTEIISLSDFLESKGTKTKEKQGQGTTLRRKLKCQSAMALAAAAKIKSRFDPGAPRNGKAFIIRSLKRPEEVEALRIIYGEAFLAIGVHTPKSKRVFYLVDEKGDINPNETIEADESAVDHYGQRIRDTFELCDVFIKGIDPDFTGLNRALKLLFGSIFTTPTQDEYAMAMAYAASLRSADLSRQVGAAIVNKSEEIVAVGPNEIPKYGGGQPWESDSPDLRDFADIKEDPNVSERDTLISNFLDLISDQFDKKAQSELPLKQDPMIRKLLKSSGLLDITEFGRTVHAEMACLMSCLRNRIDIRESKLYSTTFPCHNCVRHIIASGVAHVKYVEPYPKSRAIKLFPKFCSFWDEDYDEETGKMVPDRPGLRLEPFIGIGPRKYHDLFSMKTLSGRRIDRKDDRSGKAIRERTVNLTSLKWPSSQFGIEEREERAVQQIKSLWLEELSEDFSKLKELLPDEVAIDDKWKTVLDRDPDEPAVSIQPSKGKVTGKKKSSAKSDTHERPIVNVEENKAKEEAVDIEGIA